MLIGRATWDAKPVQHPPEQGMPPFPADAASLLPSIYPALNPDPYD